MLVVSRGKQQFIDMQIELGGTMIDISVCVLEVRGDKVRLGIDAPREVAINRREISTKLKQVRAAADAEIVEAIRQSLEDAHADMELV